MFKPYSIVEETPEETTYEFKTIYLWILYGILIVGMIGIVLRITTLTTVGGICMVIYFLTEWGQSAQRNIRATSVIEFVSGTPPWIMPLSGNLLDPDPLPRFSESRNDRPGALPFENFASAPASPAPGSTFPAGSTKAEVRDTRPSKAKSRRAKSGRARRPISI